jgi:hypothetical protein
VSGPQNFVAGPSVTFTVKSETRGYADFFNIAVNQKPPVRPAWWPLL